MRDFFLLIMLPFMLYAMAKRPFIALGMWIWTAMFFPNAWVYGLASGIRFNLLFAAVAIIGYVVWKNKPKVSLGSTGAVVLLFFGWTTLSTMGTMAQPDISWEYWSRFAKVILLFLFVICIMQKKLHIDFFLWCVVLSIGFYGSMEALKYLATGGTHKIEGFAGHVLGDRNELAVAFNMTLPLSYYLLTQYGKESKLVRIGLFGVMALLITAIIGTQSRGGFIALLSLAGYLFIKTERKILLTTMLVVVVGAFSGIVSNEWFSRMDTINNMDSDASFMGRVVAWKLSFILATNHPFFGGGFKALEYFPVWSNLSQDFLSFPFFYTGDALPDMFRGRAAHSVYFQVLSDHGFVGLGLYLCALALSFRNAGRVAALARMAGGHDWVSTLATMLQLSIFAFAVGGAALSFAYFDLIFAIYAIVIVLNLRIFPSFIAKDAMR